MPRKPDERIGKAKEMYLSGMKLVEIASQLNLPEGTVRRWKSTHKWDNERSDKKANVRKRKKGGQPGNKNAVGNNGGAPLKNKNAEKHGFFSKYLPEETFSIIAEIDKKDPLDILWENIQIAYAAIVRAQQIMYVQDKEDITTTQIQEKRWEVQQAWDKQANFLKAQAKAQGELRSLIKQYDEMLHKNWDMASEEQKARIEQIRAKTEQIQRDSGTAEKMEDDGFIEALREEANAVWQEE